MTEPRPDPGGGAEPGPAYSKDYWDQVFDQLGRRKLFNLAMFVLVLLYAMAVYAPLIASDRPYVLEAISYKEYGQAQRTLYPVSLSLGRLLEQGPAEYLASRPEGADLSFREALENESHAAHERVATMRRYLAEGERVRTLDDFLARIDEAVAVGLAGDAERARELAGEAKALASGIRKELAPLDPEDPEAGGVELSPVKSYPLWEAITATELFLMVLWAGVMTWPLWNTFVNRILLGGNRNRIRRLRKRKIAIVLLLALVAGIAWKVRVGGSMTFEAASFKENLTSGQIVATRVVFPPLSFGFAETSSGEHLRPPTWTSVSEISGEGYYLHGPRVPVADPTTGYLPPPHPVEIRYSEPATNSAWRHPLGTDSVGRDILARLVWGSRVSLSVGLVSAALLVIIGTFIGAMAGYFGGFVDFALSRLIEIVLCIPAFFLILMVVAFTDPEVVPPIIAIVVVIALVRWTGVARLARAEILRLRELELTLAARALGASSLRTIFRHILPNAIGPILVAGTFSVAAGILTESALSFLGFGVNDPIPSWGSLVNDSRSAEHWWIHVFPGFLIFVTVVCYNLVGEAIRDAVDPKMQL